MMEMQTVSGTKDCRLGSARKGALVSLLTLGLSGLLLVSGCNKSAAPAPAVPDAATTAQGVPAPTPAPTAAPTPSERMSPARPAPAPKAMVALPPPPPKQYTVPAGTSLVVTMGQTVSAKDNNVGDSFAGTLAQAVVVDGVTVLPAGSPVSGTVIAAKGQGRFKGDGTLGISVRRVSEYEVKTTSYEKDSKGKGKRTAMFVGGGGGGGALIGGLAGGGKGALIGGLLGAAGGGAGAAFTGNKNVSIPAESAVTFSLSAPITVTPKK